MRITQDVREYARQRGLASEQEALAAGMEEKAQEFREGAATSTAQTDSTGAGRSDGAARVPRPRVLTVAGSDSGGGAGIQADLKTFAALGVFGTCAITAVTAQNTLGFDGSQEMSPRVVALQIDAVLNDIGTDAVKTGMLGNAETVRAVADRMRRHRVELLVVDPVMVASTGARLLRPDAIDALREELLPLAAVVTPNAAEAEVLSGVGVSDRASAGEAARRIHQLGARLVIVTGGHWTDDVGSADDLAFDGERLEVLRARRIATPHTHGSGCTFSAAIAAHLAYGFEPLEAAHRAKRFVQRAIEYATPLGSGDAPVDHLWGISRQETADAT